MAKLDFVEASKRKENLVALAFTCFSRDQVRVNEYLSARHEEFGNKTVLEMAENDQQSYETVCGLLQLTYPNPKNA